MIYLQVGGIEEPVLLKEIHRHLSAYSPTTSTFYALT